MSAERSQKYFVISIIAHIAIVLVLILGFDFSTPLPVFENSNNKDVISAVVLGDTEKSKILPKEVTAKPLPKIAKQEPKPVEQKIEPEKELPKPEPKQQPKVQQAEVKKDEIALEIAKKKKLAEEKAEEEKKKRELLEKNLLADIQKETKKRKVVKQKELKSQFQKLLREQAEKSLRQNLINEEIKLQGTVSRQAQGEVNKYNALILQAMSEHWIIPPQVNKKLTCELLVRLAPGGTVLDVQITKSSGDPALDSSARAAVLKSSPLPVPSDPEAFAAFRKFILKAKPENILAAT